MGLVNKKWFVPVVLLILAVIALSSLFEGDSKQANTTLTTEQRLEEMCNLVRGVSNAKVMITYEATTVSTFGYGKGEERISGIAIACDGGENPSVKLALYELVNALFDIKSTRITVSPRN